MSDVQDQAQVNHEEIEVHWQPPRYDQENAVLLVWPNMLRDKWAAEVSDDGVAWVVSHTTLYEDSGTGEIEKMSRPVSPNEEIPRHVALALLDYDSEYGPVREVANSYPEEDEPGLPDDQTELEA